MITSQLRRHIIAIVICMMACLLQGCPSPHLTPEPSLAGMILGVWAWDSTATPSHVVTPKSVGYTKQLLVLRDNQRAFVSFYRNDTLQLQVNEAFADSAQLVEDKTAATVLVKYIMPDVGYRNKSTYLKYRINLNANPVTLIVSEFLNPYTEKADTVHTYYEAVRYRPPLYPY